MNVFQETRWFKVKDSRMLKQQVIKLVLIVVDKKVLGFDAFEDGNNAGLEVVEEERLLPTREVLSQHLYNLYHTIQVRLVLFIELQTKDKVLSLTILVQSVTSLASWRLN